MLKKFLVLIGLLAAVICLATFSVAPYGPSISLRRNMAAFFYEHEYDQAAVFVWKSLRNNGDDIAVSNLAALDYWSYFRPETYDHEKRRENYLKADKALYEISLRTSVAEFNRAIIRLYGGVDSEWFKSGVEFMKRAAKMGHPIAALAVQRFEETKSDTEFYRVLADNGDPFASYSVAFDLFADLDARCDSIPYYRKAADAGIQEAMVEYGEYLVRATFVYCKKLASGANGGITAETVPSSDKDQVQVRFDQDYQEGKALLRKAAGMGNRRAIIDLLNCHGTYVVERPCRLREISEIASLYDRAVDESLDNYTSPPRNRLNEDGALELNIWHIVNGGNPHLQVSLTDAANHTLGLMHVVGSELPLDLDKAKYYFNKVPDSYSHDPRDLMPVFKNNEQEIKAIAAKFFPNGNVESDIKNVELRKLLVDGVIDRITIFDIFENEELYKYDILSLTKRHNLRSIFKFNENFSASDFSMISSELMDFVDVKEDQTRSVSKDKLMIRICQAINNGNSILERMLLLSDGSIIDQRSHVIVTFDSENIRVTSLTKGKTVSIPKKYIIEAKSWTPEDVRRTYLAP